MPKSRPVEVHVNSRGRKHMKLQELLHSENTYLFLSVDATYKTTLFNKGFLDGRKHPVQLQASYEESHDECFVLAVERGLVQNKLDAQNQFFGILPLERTFLIDSREADQFIENVCMDCEFYGEAGCYSNNFTCAEEDRDRYRDSPHFEALKETRQERRRQTFPVTG